LPQLQQRVQVLLDFRPLWQLQIYSNNMPSWLLQTLDRMRHQEVLKMGHPWPFPHWHGQFFKYEQNDKKYCKILFSPS